MAKHAWKGPRKRRTIEHVISEMSVNFLERQILRRGHQLMRPPQLEYGVDGYMLHFDEDGFVENGLVYFQVKATGSVKFVDKGRAISVTVEGAHLHQWSWVVHHPVILVLYDAEEKRAYWFDVKAFADQHQLDPEGETVTFRIPTKNKLDLRAIDTFRELSLAEM